MMELIGGMQRFEEYTIALGSGERVRVRRARGGDETLQQRVMPLLHAPRASLLERRHRVDTHYELDLRCAARDCH
jgi:hypothetical protein